MTIKLKNKADFNHAVSYLQNQTYNFNRYDTQLMIGFSQDCRAQLAVEELTETQGIFVESVTQDLLETFA